LLQHGAERIYSFGATTKAWDGSWFVVICSVPEMQRARRHQYRTQMAFEGFGFIAPGVAVSPHLNRENAANNILRSLNLDADATTFVATSGSLTVDDEVLSDAWNLAALTQRYQEFLNKFDGGTPASGRDAFAQSILMVDAWRRFPFIDPELPAELLPPDWIGARAHTMFAQHRIRWAQPAVGWYTETESSTTSNDWTRPPCVMAGDSVSGQQASQRQQLREHRHHLGRCDRGQFLRARHELKNISSRAKRILGRGSLSAYPIGISTVGTSVSGSSRTSANPFGSKPSIGHESNPSALAPLMPLPSARYVCR
jgi:hypothetical protein